MSLLTIVQNASNMCSLPEPATVVNNTNQATKEMLSILNSLGTELMQEFSWSVLRKEGTFTTVAAAEQVTVATEWTDLDRFLPETFFNRTERRKIFGPVTAQIWQWDRSVVSQTVFDTVYFRDGKLFLTPNPSAGESVYFEYISKNWCKSSGGTGQSAFAADTDLGVIDELILQLGLIYRWKQQHSFPYAEDQQRFNLHVNRRFGQETPRAKLNLAGARLNDLMDPNIPDNSWTL